MTDLKSAERGAERSFLGKREFDHIHCDLKVNEYSVGAA